MEKSYKNIIFGREENSKINIVDTTKQYLK